MKTNIFPSPVLTKDINYQQCPSSITITNPVGIIRCFGANIKKILERRFAVPPFILPAIIMRDITKQMKMNDLKFTLKNKHLPDIN